MAINFKPTKMKLLLTLILVLVVILIQLFFPLPVTDAPQSYGIPFVFKEQGCHGMPPMGQEQVCVNTVSSINLIGNVAVWAILFYLISSLAEQKKSNK